VTALVTPLLVGAVTALVTPLLVGAVVGLVVGALGGGGGVLTVPILVYLLGQDPARRPRWMQGPRFHPAPLPPLPG